MLQPAAESIWTHQQAIRFGGIPLWHCMTAIRLANGSVVLHSPTRLSVQLVAEIRELGTVAAIVAPSWWHDLYLKEWLHAFPAAKLYAAATLAKWAKALPIEDVLTDAAPPIWRGELEQCGIEGIGLFLDEVAFYHPLSGSLIVADLLFNISNDDAWITRVLGSVVIGPYPGCRFARMYRPFVFNRDTFRTSIERILRWDFTQILVGHGAVVRNSAKQAFRSAFNWLLT